MDVGRPNLGKVFKWSAYLDEDFEDKAEGIDYFEEAQAFLTAHKWCFDVSECYIGLLFPGIVGVFLFRIVPEREDVDEWVWVIVGDLPPAYITIDVCPNPAAALDGYIVAMMDWVDAVRQGRPVDDLIPVNGAATLRNANDLASRLNFLDQKILVDFQDDLKE